MDTSAISEWNLLPEARQATAGRRILLCDCTIREGEQTAGVSLNLQDKLRIVRALDNLGVDQVQVGWPAASEEDRQVTEAIVGLGLRAKVEGIANTQAADWQAEIDACLRARVDVVSLQFGVSRLRRALAETDEAADLAHLQRAGHYAVARAPFVSFSLTDATRAEPDFLLRAYGVLQEAGVHRVRLNDSVGSISPAAFRVLATRVRRAVTSQLGIHCHNDYGLAMANVCVGAEVGVDLVDVTVNGLGDRAGNPPLDEVALTLMDLYGCTVGIDPGGLKAVSDLVAELSGVGVWPSKPITGAYVFAHVLDRHVAAVGRDPRVFEAFPPERVGNRRRFPLGRQSGSHAVRVALREAGIGEESVDLPVLVARVQAACTGLRRVLTAAEFVRLAEQSRLPQPA